MFIFFEEPTYCFLHRLHHFTFPPTVHKCCSFCIVLPTLLTFLCLFVCFLNIYLFIYLFIYGCVGSPFLCEGSLQLRQAGATPHRGARAPTIAASPAAEHRLQTRRLSSRGSRAQPLRGMRDPPRPGPEHVSPALAGGPSTTAPPGKPCVF